MARTNYGGIPHSSAKYYADEMTRLAKPAATGWGASMKPDKRWFMGLRREKGKRREFLLWDRKEFVGAFPTREARRAYVTTTETLEKEES